jgi:glutathione synthase/RimK-type ligase-like ATP-grasp enzyme
MPTRVLVLSAGTGATNNLMRGLRDGYEGLGIVGCHADRFTLRKSPADRNYVVPEPTDAAFLPALRAIVARETIDLVIPGNDGDVLALSGLRQALPGILFLPTATAIATCQDKYRLSTLLRERGVPAPLTLPVPDLEGIDAIFAELDRPRLWCRIRSGSGSRGAIPVVRAEQARAWIAYWSEMRGVPVTAFTLSEYLPGRDFAAQALWRDGTLVLVKLCERLSYFGGGSQPSGISSTPALARMAKAPEAVTVCVDAVRAVDPRASGVFSIDLKEDAAGRPCVTEINAGRFCMITPFFDATGRHNMAATYVRLARGEAAAIPEPYEVVEDWYMVRDLDTLPGIFRGDDVFDGLEDVLEADSSAPS